MRVEICQTGNGGRSWTLTALQVPQEDMTALGDGEALPHVVQSARQGTLEVTGTMNGRRRQVVYATNDGGATWLLGARSTPASGG